MVFQKVLKGVNGLDAIKAQQIVDNGLLSNWWRTAGRITPAEIKLHLNSVNADLHLNHYHKPIPIGNPLTKYGKAKFGDVTPFISTTAGVVERDGNSKQNLFFPPFMTALRFATDNFKSTGYVFYAYLITIGKKAIEMEQFSEEIRELHVYSEYQRYFRQGEIMAKILIPSVQIEKAIGYDGPSALRDLKAGRIPSFSHSVTNSSYQEPEKLSNIREILS